MARFLWNVMSKVHKYGECNQPFTVLIEGNISSGKTTFLRHFDKFKDELCLIAEPLEKWRDLNGVNLLNLLYKDPQHWAMPFQTYATLTSLESHTQSTNKRLKIMERSIFSARYCFVEAMHKMGQIDAGMYKILQEWYKFIDKSLHIQADLIIYLRTSPEICYERIRSRARSEENCVPLEYLKHLHELHEDWLIHRRVGTPTKVLVLNGDLSLDSIDSEYKRSEITIFDAASTTSAQYPQAPTIV